MVDCNIKNLFLKNFQAELINEAMKSDKKIHLLSHHPYLSIYPFLDKKEVVDWIINHLKAYKKYTKGKFKLKEFNNHCNWESETIKIKKILNTKIQIYI